MNKKTLWSLTIFVLVALAALMWRNASGTHHRTEVPVSGNMEVTEVRVSFRIPGRISERFVDEGDSVSSGQVIARLDTTELAKEVALREAEKSVAEAALKELQSGALPEEIAQAKAKRDQADADFNRLATDFERQKKLFEQEVISKREFDISRAAYEVAESRVQEARKALDLIEKGVREEKIEQAEARLKQATEALSIAETRLGYSELTSPISGSVLSKGAEAGEVVSAGTPIITVGNLNDIWFRAFISETDLGRVKLGDRVKIKTDTYPDKAYEGRLSFISSEAEFTPKNIQTAEERVKLVYRIKVNVENPSQELKPGMPADGVILIAPSQKP